MGKLASVGVAGLFIVAWLSAKDANAMGGRIKPGPTREIAAAHEIPGYEVPEDAQAFPNYVKWNKSRLPKFLQVAHCTGMALLSRQIFNWASFAPEQPRLTLRQYRSLLHRIFWIPTSTLPGEREKIVIPGYANWNEMTRETEIVDAIKDILGNAIKDIFRRNWNWFPLDAFGSTRRSRSMIELNIRESVSRDRVAMIYLTRGFKTAHAVLAYAYEVLPDRVRYQVYDSNHPTRPTTIEFRFSENRFHHPDWGMRDPWILHPYRDEFRSSRDYLRLMKESLASP